MVNGSTDKNDSQGDWKITTKRYIAFFDIMGFKDMVARSSHKEIYDMMKKINDIMKESTGYDWAKTKVNYVKSTFFSDSIIIYSKDDSYNSAVALINTACTVTTDLLTNSIPHKGAIAFGEMSVDINNSILFGQPLIDAYLLQEEMNLYAVVLHASAENELVERKHETIDIMLHDYPCQFKAGIAFHKMLPPAYTFLTFNDTDPEIKQSKVAFFNGVENLRLKTSGHIRKYIDNTNGYISAIMKNNNKTR